MSDTKTRRYLYSTECLIGDFQKILQKEISETIQYLSMETYELEIDLKIPDMGKISMHILEFEELIDFTAPWQCENKEMVTVLIILWIQ